jgi:hypothetical protein
MLIGQLRICRNYGEKNTRARLERKVNSRRFCPILIKEKFKNPLSCSPAATRYRSFFPKYERPHEGKDEESLVDGLYFEHSLDGRLFLCTVFATALLFSASTLVIFIYWWRGPQHDLVGSSNIGAFIMGVGAVWIGVLMAVPMLWNLKG